MAEKTAVLVVDMLNPYNHEDAAQLTRSVEDVVGPIQELVQRASKEAVELIYVNDNYGDWHSSQGDLAKHALEGERPDLVEPILPPEGTDFVVKARHSVFYTTPLEYLLRQREVDHLVLAGQVTEQCILYSALDAYVRHFEVTVARDGVAHVDEGLADAALELMTRNMDAEIAPCADCTLADRRKGA